MRLYIIIIIINLVCIKRKALKLVEMNFVRYSVEFILSHYLFVAFVPQK